MRCSTTFTLLVPLLIIATSARADVLEAPHVKVEYSGIIEAQARSLAETLSAARQVYVEQFKLDMPEQLFLSVECAPGRPTRLHTNGSERVFLSLPSQAKLAPPLKSGVFNLYGMCHEAGHIAMYRTLKHRPWLSGPGAEGWAHFGGSVVVDHLFDTKGPALWFEPYEYRAEGTARLDRALSMGPDDVSRAADQWRKLEAIIGRDGFVRLFQAWDAVDSSAPDPSPLLHSAMTAIWPDKAEELTDWWKDAAPVLVEWVRASPTKPQVIAPQKLSGHPVTLKRDDDTADSKRSIGGGGHALRFDAPDAAREWYLVGVWIHGSRYGPAKAPGTMFQIALCDTEMRPIQSWRKPYAAFERGEMQWVRFEFPAATRVGQQFYICLDFQPSASNGVYVSIDNSSSGHSQVARPGKSGRALEGGDWMIRVELDTPKEPTTQPDEAQRAPQAGAR